MGLLNLPVDFFNVIIFPIIIGIGIDSSVHIYNRYTEEGDMLKSVTLTGEAVSLSALTTLIGFGSPRRRPQRRRTQHRFYCHHRRLLRLCYGDFYHACTDLVFESAEKGKGKKLIYDSEGQNFNGC